MRAHRSGSARRGAGIAAALTLSIAIAFGAVLWTSVAPTVFAQYLVNEHLDDCSVFRNPDGGTSFWSQHGLCYCEESGTRALRCDNLCTYTGPQWCYSPEESGESGGSNTTGGTTGGTTSGPTGGTTGGTGWSYVGRERTCSGEFSRCGTDASAKADCHDEGKDVSWWTPSDPDDWCYYPDRDSPNRERAACYSCGGAVVPEGDGGGDGDGDGVGDGVGDGDPPPMCPVGCQVDADCGDAMNCSMDWRDPTKVLCWRDAESNLCVKKCKVPRCVDNVCKMAPPAEGTPGYPYVQCGTDECPPPRCGDGVVQGAGADEDPDDNDDGDDGDDAIDWSCQSDFPSCGIAFDDEVADQLCPSGTYLEWGARRCSPWNEQAKMCYRCTPNDNSGAETCNVTGTSCAQVPDARACKEPYCVDVNGRRIQNTQCDCPVQQARNECPQDYPVCPFWGMQAHMYCPPEHTLQAGNGFTCTDGVGYTVQCAKCVPFDCSNGYRGVSGQLQTARPIGCHHFIQAPNSICNCIMAALPGTSPTAPVASLLKGSSLLATSIVNACGSTVGTSCTPTFVERFCGAGDACFALLGANSLIQRCAPADCMGREAECGMTDPRWEMCGGTEQPPGGTDGEPGEPVPEGGEECDDGNNDGNDGCSPSCKQERCGDGATQPKGADGKPNTTDDEECDDGNLDLGDGCTNRCKIETCGNGKHEYGEECDNGDENSDTEPGACRTDCKLPKCNDGVIDVRNDDFGLDEQCDCGPEYADFDWEAANEPGSTLKPYCETVVDGKPALCHVGNCQAFYCGDGAVFNAGLDLESGTEDDEMCDNGPFNTDGLPEGDECENAAQCGGSPCVDGQCEVHSCTTDYDCLKGGTCIKGVCREGGCNADADCKAGQTCNANGNCSSCTVDTDCASGFCYPNAQCAPVVPCEGESCAAFHPYTCRNDCKAARCGDGIVDPGEKCDEGEAMMKCNGYPQPACDCAIPSWGSHTPGVGPFNTTCCPENQYCTIWETDTCPANCGVEPDVACGNGTLEAGEECDISEAFGALYVFRPNRDGTKLSFMEDDGRWTIVPSAIEQKYTTVDHESATVSPDNAFIRSAANGVSITYFHLWDVLATESIVNNIRLRVGVDFTGQGTDWKVQEIEMLMKRRPFRMVLGMQELNSAILSVQADAAKHQLAFALYNAANGEQLTEIAVIPSTVQVPAASRVDVDAIELVVQVGGKDEGVCADCVLKRCGNMRVEEGEECDDGNTASDDGCNNECRVEICRLPPER